MLDQPPGRLGHHPVELGALFFEPAFESIGLRNVKAGQQLSPVPVDRPFIVAPFEGFQHIANVAGHHGGIEAYQVGFRNQGVLAELSPKYLKKLAERGAGVVARRFGPEQGAQNVAAMEAKRPGQREPGHQSKAFGVGQRRGGIGRTDRYGD